MLDGKLDESVILDEDKIENVERFSYLGDAISTGGVQEAVTARIRAGWKKFRDILSVLCKNDLSLKLKGIIYKSCVRSILCMALSAGQ